MTSGEATLPLFLIGIYRACPSVFSIRDAYPSETRLYSLTTRISCRIGVPPSTVISAQKVRSSRISAMAGTLTDACNVFPAPQTPSTVCVPSSVTVPLDTIVNLKVTGLSINLVPSFFTVEVRTNPVFGYTYSVFTASAFSSTVTAFEYGV